MPELFAQSLLLLLMSMKQKVYLEMHGDVSDRLPPRPMLVCKANGKLEMVVIGLVKKRTAAKCCDKMH